MNFSYFCLLANTVIVIFWFQLCEQCSFYCSFLNCVSHWRWVLLADVGANKSTSHELVIFKLRSCKEGGFIILTSVGDNRQHEGSHRCDWSTYGCARWNHYKVVLVEHFIISSSIGILWCLSSRASSPQPSWLVLHSSIPKSNCPLIYTIMLKILTTLKNIMINSLFANS